MKSILLLTDVDFWKEGAGRRMRIIQLVKYISAHTDLTIVYIGLGINVDEVVLSNNFNCKFIFLEKNEILEPEQYGHRLQMIFKNSHFDSCIIEYIHNSFYLQYFPESIKIILDTHDIVSDRTESFRNSQYYSSVYEMSREVEFQLFEIYDYIIAICEPDLNKLKEVIPKNKLILCPHPAIIVQKMIQRVVRNISFIGSDYSPNKDAIEFFLKECWQDISAKYHVNLNIYGEVTKILGEFRGKGIHIRGYVKDINEIYRESDVIINPVRLGAGIKIKNIEALAYGLPLVTTSHGARGLEKGINIAFLVADVPSGFIQCISDFIEKYELREKMSNGAHKFIAEDFSPAICFKPLLEVINL